MNTLTYLTDVPLVARVTIALGWVFTLLSTYRQKGHVVLSFVSIFSFLLVIYGWLCLAYFVAFQHTRRNLYLWIGTPLTLFWMVCAALLIMEVQRSDNWLFRDGMMLNNLNITFIAVQLSIFFGNGRAATSEYQRLSGFLFLQRPTGNPPTLLPHQQRRTVVASIIMSTLALGMGVYGYIAVGIQVCSWPDVWLHRSSCIGTLVQSDMVSRSINTIVYSPDGELFATTSHNNAARVWRRDGTHLYDLPHKEWVTSVAFSPNGEFIATAARQDGVSVWSARDGRKVLSLTNTQEIRSIEFSPDSATIFTGSDTGVISQWQFGDKNLVHTLEPSDSDGRIEDIAVSADGTLIAAAIYTSPGGIVQVWNIANRTLQATLSTDAVYHVAFAPDRPLLATAGFGPVVQVWDVVQEKLQYETHWQTLDDERFVWQVAFSPDGQLLAAGADDHSIRVWDMHTMAMVRQFTYTDGIQSIAFDPQESMITSGSWDGTVRRWSLSPTYDSH